MTHLLRHSNTFFK